MGLNFRPIFLGTLILCASLSLAQQSATVQLPDSIAAPGAAVTWVKKITRYCEGPAIDAEGNLYFTEQRSNSELDWPIWKINPANASDTGTILVQHSNQSNGLTFDTEDRLIADQKGKIARYTTAGALDSVLTTSGSGATFNQANDLSLGNSGGIYFTDLGSQVFYLDPSRHLKTAASGLSGANGIEWVEEDKAVYVLEGGKNQITRLDVGTDGTLTNPRSFIKVTGPDGADLDIHGNWYVGSWSDGTVYVFNAKAVQIGKIIFHMDPGQYDINPGVNGNICNCHFGGSDFKTLFCTGDGGVYSIPLKIPGRRPLASTAIASGPPAPAKANVTRRLPKAFNVIREGRDMSGRLMREERGGSGSMAATDDLKAESRTEDARR